MALTRDEYHQLIARSDAGEICLFFDPAQCKDFLLKLDNAEALSRIGNPLRFESGLVRTIVNFIEPASLLAAILAGFLWLKWWGFLTAPGVFVFWMLLKSMSSGGRQRIVVPMVIFLLGVALTVVFRDQGTGYITFALALSVLYLSEKMLYTLPVMFFSLLARSNYELVNMVYEKPVDDLNSEMGVPLMWYVETPEGKLPQAKQKLPSRLFLTLYGFFNKQCRTKAFRGRGKPPR